MIYRCQSRENIVRRIKDCSMSTLATSRDCLFTSFVSILVVSDLFFPFFLGIVHSERQLLGIHLGLPGLDPLEHTWSRSDLMCREGRASKTPSCCRGHSTVFDSCDDISTLADRISLRMHILIVSNDSQLLKDDF